MLERKVNIITEKLTQKEYEDQVNPFNIELISRLKLYFIFRKEDRNVRNVFLHNVISEWFEMQSPNEFATFRRLKKLIRKTKIELTDVEQYEVDLLEERLFSSIRHIKQLDVNYRLLPRETVWVKFNYGEIFENTKDYPTLVARGDLLFTQDRMILETKEKHNHDFNIFWENVKNIKFDDVNGLTLYTYEEREFVVKIHDSKSLNNTFKNMIEKKVKPLIKFL